MAKVIITLEDSELGATASFDFDPQLTGSDERYTNAQALALLVKATIPDLAQQMNDATD